VSARSGIYKLSGNKLEPLVIPDQHQRSMGYITAAAFSPGGRHVLLTTRMWGSSKVGDGSPSWT